MRTAVIILATIGLCGICHSSSAVAAPRPTDSVVVAAKDIQVGDTLQATKDVSLDSAVIAEGSKISVSAKKSANGRVILDVALADGHVVKGVPLAEIKKSFRRVAS
jgi:Flp pilus assembly protein CpaB